MSDVWYIHNYDKLVQDFRGSASFYYYNFASFHIHTYIHTYIYLIKQVNKVGNYKAAVDLLTKN